jgi:hypothetical protein
MRTRRRLACAALIVAGVALVPAVATAQGAWPPNPPPEKVKPHIGCWQTGNGFCWIAWVW